MKTLALPARRRLASPRGRYVVARNTPLAADTRELLRFDDLPAARAYAAALRALGASVQVATLTITRSWGDDESPGPRKANARLAPGATHDTGQQANSQNTTTAGAIKSHPVAEMFPLLKEAKPKPAAKPTAKRVISAKELADDYRKRIAHDYLEISADGKHEFINRLFAIVKQFVGELPGAEGHAKRIIAELSQMKQTDMADPAWFAGQLHFHASRLNPLKVAL